MASKVYCKMWLATCDDIADVLLREKVTQALEPVTEPLRAHRIFASLYARYVMLVNRLGDIYDQTLQVQKRALVRRVLELATQRLVELQLELKNIEMSEFLYIDQTLIEEKYGVEDVQMLSPFYYPMPRSSELQAVLDGVRKPRAPSTAAEDGDEEGEAGAAAPMTTIQLLLAEQKRLADLEASRVDPWADAIRLLQIHEKARQARCQFTYIRLHPHIYTPKPPEQLGPKPYVFYHKPDTPMLIPVKHTMYESNFIRKLRTFSQVQFYVNPMRTLTEAPDDNADDNGDETRPETAETIVESVEDKDAVEESPVVIDVDVENEDEARERASMLRIRDAEAARIARRELRNAAATRIQRCFLRWQIKRLVRQTTFERYCRIGMADRRRWDYRDRDFTEATRRATAAKKAAFDEAFRRACEDTRNRIVQLRTPWIMEDISDHIRAWFRDMWLASDEREFDKYPPAAKGGTILVLQGLTPSPWEFVEFLKRRDELAAMTPEQRKKIADEAKAAKKAEKKAKREAKKKKARAKAEKRKAQLKNGPSWEFQDDDFITKNFLGLDQQMIDYQREWRFIDEFANPASAPYMDWVQLDEYAKVHMELRPVVDELMRIEYELLQMARALDQKKKYKAPGPPKVRKPKKGKKKKVPPPITFGDRDVEEVYDELLEHGVIQAYPKRRMEDLIGDRNFGAYEMRNFNNGDPLHCMGEVKDVLRHYILGMGDIQFKHPKSMCIFGPPGCGKKYMVDALANEMGVVKFDLSARVVVRFRDDLKTFADNVVKMARLMQPSMLFMDGAHNPFIKKIAPENVAEQPKLIGPYLPKMVKALKATDRVMLVGTTSEPWNCALGPLKKCFEVMVMCPGADYGTTLLTWRTGLLGMEGTDRLMDFSALAKVTQQYGIKQMLDTVNRVVDLERRVFLERRPLNQDDLLDDLLTGIPPNFPMDPADMNKYRKFFAQANKYQKVRAKKQAEIAAAAVAVAAKK